MSHSLLRVMVVDDTIHYRRLLSELVESLGDTEIVATASRGDLALVKLQSGGTDLVLLDLEMPEMNGLETLREIRKLHSEVNVVMIAGRTSSTDKDKAETLRLGALDFIEKPETSDRDRSIHELKQKLEASLKRVRIRQNLTGSRSHSAGVSSLDSPRAAPVSVAESPRGTLVSRTATPAAINYAVSELKRIDIVAIGISTGGPEALMQLIPSLPADLGVPVLLVQHMPAQFTASLAQDIARKSKIMVREASEGELIGPGAVLIAPGGRHMIVRPVRSAITGQVEHMIGLNDGPLENSCRPAVDVLFRSVAMHYKGNVLAVIMTGMGADGCEGVRVMRAAGCYCITQSAATCVVYGMPMAVDEAGLSNESVPLNLLAARITSLVKGKGRP